MHERIAGLNQMERNTKDNAIPGPLRKVEMIPSRKGVISLVLASIAEARKRWRGRSGAAAEPLPAQKAMEA